MTVIPTLDGLVVLQRKMKKFSTFRLSTNTKSSTFWGVGITNTNAERRNLLEKKALCFMYYTQTYDICQGEDGFGLCLSVRPSVLSSTFVKDLPWGFRSLYFRDPSMDLSCSYTKIQRYTCISLYLHFDQTSR